MKQPGRGHDLSSYSNPRPGPLWQQAVVGSLVYLAWLLRQPVYRPPIIGGDGIVYQ